MAAAISPDQVGVFLGRLLLGVKMGAGSRYRLCIQVAELLGAVALLRSELGGVSAAAALYQEGHPAPDEELARSLMCALAELDALGPFVATYRDLLQATAADFKVPPPAEPEPSAG